MRQRYAGEYQQSYHWQFTNLVMDIQAKHMRYYPIGTTSYTVNKVEPIKIGGSIYDSGIEKKETLVDLAPFGMMVFLGCFSGFSNNCNIL